MNSLFSTTKIATIGARCFVRSKSTSIHPYSNVFGHRRLASNGDRLTFSTSIPVTMEPTSAPSRPWNLKGERKSTFRRVTEVLEHDLIWGTIVGRW
jgi:hypothetical protein